MKQYKNTINTSTHTATTLSHYKSHTHTHITKPTHTHTLQNPHIHTHPYITKQVKITTVQVKTKTVQDIP